MNTVFVKLMIWCTFCHSHYICKKWIPDDAIFLGIYLCYFYTYLNYLYSYFNVCMILIIILQDHSSWPCSWFYDVIFRFLYSSLRKTSNWIQKCFGFRCFYWLGQSCFPQSQIFLRTEKNESFIDEKYCSKNMLLCHFMEINFFHIFYFQYVRLEAIIPVKGGKMIPYHSLMGNIEFNNVSFSYPTRPDQVSCMTTTLLIELHEQKI